jgi:glutamate formiminotransferase / 5-formyltetrahydrofolate cyclo-ligase
LVLECVPNVSEGQDARVIAALADACGPTLLDVHSDADHHRSVFTLAGPGPRDAVGAVQALARVVAEQIDLRAHRGVHPRLGALDVVPFVAFDEPRQAAVDAAVAFADWVAAALGLPVFLYDRADPAGRGLPDARRDAFGARAPDRGPASPDPRLGAVAVGARAPLIAVNCWLDTRDVAIAREIASSVRERDGGLPGVRALGLALPGADATQVAMNLVDLDRTGLEAACTDVRRRADAAGSHVTRVELVGLVPAAELAMCSQAFLDWTGLGPDVTIESRLAR